jgi:hypothetical protein
VWGAGNVPARKPINVTTDQAHCLGKGPLLEEMWVINPENKGIQWAFVWLAPEPGSGKLPIHPDLQKVDRRQVPIDQPHCAFEPHAVAVREGQELIANNSSSITHNVNWTGGLKNPGKNVVIGAGQTYTFGGLVADRYPVKLTCNIHPWMNAWVRVFDHPYFAVTDADGAFEIKSAPAGHSRLVIWHESAGYRGGKEGRVGMPVTIKSNETAEVGVVALTP